MKILKQIFGLLADYKYQRIIEKKEEEFKKIIEEEEKWAWAEDDKKSENNDKFYTKFKEKKLFTQSEQKFMDELLEYTKNNDIQVLSKVRLADMVEVQNNLEFGEKRGLFNKIKSKHIDFVIIDTKGQIKCLIELDWWNHYSDIQTQENDKFKNELFETLWLNLVRFKVWQTDFEKLNQYLT